MSIVLQGLEKAFGPSRVLQGVTETFDQARISVLLGPSGCGKTTTLRCIAGLERPSGGRIQIDGRTVYQERPAVWVAPERRNVSMMFQSYAIWPHMTVFDNVGLPLRAAGVDRRRIRQAVTATLELVGLDAYAARNATQLSGGQQQRVALARCIVSESPVILMDEPLSNLDARLRVAMRSEIRDLQKRLGRTILFVTHDQEEAMSLADTLYLYRNGSVVQKGAPKDVYDHPASGYAAEFLGRANLIGEFDWRSAGDASEVVLPGGAVLRTGLRERPAEGARLCIRPEKWRIVDADGPDVLRGRIEQASFVGDRTEYRVATDAGSMLAVQLDGELRQPGEQIGLAVRPGDIGIVRE
ncbi:MULTISPECIES: ABC transporter ATP-binding protein [unclassified Achromobacter]|uniref:ABC transporter ATP-binding protein n=1 Tax=unclassified Achromobacter TaxID=2626865 RepID=UPI00069F99E8|nr:MULTISPECIES: ABC transporter ATP-binding protein [unclassified Achromobacter]